MHKIAEYGLIFIVSVLLQVFLFDNLTVSPYLYPLVYAGCIILLPANIDRALLLILSFALGLSVDLLSGMARPQHHSRHGYGIPAPCTAQPDRRQGCGPGGFHAVAAQHGTHEMAAVMRRRPFAVHCTVFFLFEAMTFKYFGFTLLRIAGSTVTTTLLVWFAASLLPTGRSHGSQT